MEAAQSRTSGEVGAAGRTLETRASILAEVRRGVAGECEYLAAILLCYQIYFYPRAPCPSSESFDLTCLFCSSDSRPLQYLLWRPESAQKLYDVCSISGPGDSAGIWRAASLGTVRSLQTQAPILGYLCRSIANPGMLNSPPGVTSNLVNPSSRGELVVIGSAIIIPIVTIFVIVRTYTKARINKTGLGRDDCLTPFAKADCNLVY